MSPIIVRIDNRARQDSKRHAEAMPWGYETGGLLISRRSYDRATIELLDAAERRRDPQPRARHRRSPTDVNPRTA